MTINIDETCWCCDAMMTMKVVPYVGAEVWWCAVCDPNFDYVSFIENYEFWSGD